MQKINASHDVYYSLRDMILDFTLYPGSRITETELADIFKVSRTPIRSALQRLEAEGYLTIRPKQGCFIRNVDIESLSEYYTVRIALEDLTLQLVNTYMSDVDLKALAEEWNPENWSQEQLGIDDMEARDESFHMALAEGSNNMALVHYLKDINRHIRVIRRLDFSKDKRIEVTYEEHYEICQHLLRRDLAAAQKTMQSHIRQSENFARNLTLTQLAQKKSPALKKL